MNLYCRFFNSTCRNAQASLDRMQELAKRETNVSGVEVKVEDTSSKLRDMRVQVGRANDRSVQTELLNRRNKQRLTAIQVSFIGC